VVSVADWESPLLQFRAQAAGEGMCSLEVQRIFNHALFLNPSGNINVNFGMLTNPDAVDRRVLPSRSDAGVGIGFVPLPSAAELIKP